MPSSLIALQIFFILLPGFAAGYVVQFLATRKTQSDLERIVEALLFSFLIYICFSWINHGSLPFELIRTTIGGTETDTVVWQAGSQVLVLAAITFAFALAAVAYIRWDGNRIFRWAHLTERTTHNSIWNDVLESEAGESQVVQIELADGRSVMGVLLYYSDSAEDGSVFLTQAAWVTEKGERISIPGQGILLTKESGIRSISLLEPGSG